MKADAKKTLIFILVAGMAVLVAWEPWRPGSLETSAPADVGTKLFPDFTNALAAKSLEIVKFNEQTAAIRDFKVAQTGGVWSIPSHSNYPADAKEHMAEAATSLMDLKILNLASDRPGDQKEYGVITPDPAKLRVGMTGVGTRVTVRDGKDKVLADLVIGKEVKDQPALRYVRRAERDQIYTVSVKTDKLSTKFEDWIEKDLLKLNTFDVRKVELNDYSSQVGVSQGRPVLELDKRALIKLAFDDAKSQWNLEELLEYADNSNEAKPAALAADEELDTQKLNDLKNALDDLQIVDVERKPGGLSQDLRASDEFLNNTEALQSLAERGFVPVPVGDQREIFSSEGEVTCTTKDGVRYVLRFGNLAGTSMPDEDEKDADGKPKTAAPNRYLFVMAQFDESQIPKPEPVEEPKPADASSEEKDQPEAKDAAGAAPKPVDAKPTDVKPAAKSVPEKKTAELQDDKAGPAEEDLKAPVADPPKAEDAKEADEKPADDKPADDKPADEKKEPAKEPTAEEVEKLAREKEAKRRQDEYDAAVKRGQDKVKELNDRFADWYFIISDDVYKKIHLGRADVIKKKAADKKDGAADLNDLEDAIKIGPGAKDAPK